MRLDVLTGISYRAENLRAGRNRPGMSWHLAVALTFMMYYQTQQQQVTAALVESSQFDGEISRDGDTLDVPLTSILTDENETGAFLQFVQDSVDDTAAAFSASSNLQPELFQHVYSYASPDGDTVYSSENLTRNVVSELITPERATAIKGRFLQQGNRFRLVDELVLDGEVVMSTEQGRNLKGLNATFEVRIVKEFERANGSTARQRFFRGKVRLKGKRNGQVRVQTGGRIKKRHISDVFTDNGLIHVQFDDVAIPFRTRVLLGQDYRFATQYSSQTTNIGAGTGAEINFSPDLTQLPDFVEMGRIPEPASLSLLTAGLLGLVLKRKKSEVSIKKINVRCGICA